MRKHLVGWICLVLLLAACSGGGEDEQASESENLPTPTPTAITSGYSGPSLLGAGNTGESACEAGDACLDENGEVIEVTGESLSLTPQTIGALTVGVPEGYSPLDMGDQVAISAVDASTPGGFMVIIQPVEASQQETIQARFGETAQATRIETPHLSGYVRAQGEDGAYALLETPDGQQIWVEGFASAAYWPSLRPTFDAMLESLIYDTDAARTGQ